MRRFLLFLRAFWQSDVPQAPTVPVPPPPLPSSLPSLPSEVSFERWDWELDIQPYLEWRMGEMLRDLLTTQNADEIRYKQGRAQELYEILRLRDLERWRARDRAEREREKVPNAR